jgi:hypothetical protein
MGMTDSVEGRAMEYIVDALAIVGAYAIIAKLFDLVYVCNVTKQRCKQCDKHFSVEAARIAPEFYQARFHPRVVVFDGPRRYKGSRVVRCEHCGTEMVVSELGRFVEEYNNTVNCDE